MSVTISGVTIHSRTDLGSLKTADLLALYNKLTGKKTTKFASRDKGEGQVWAAIKAAPAEAATSNKEAAAKPAVKDAPKSEPKAKAPRAKRQRSYKFNYEPDAEVQGHREGTKRAKVIELLSRPAGANFQEVRDATSWDEKTAYDGIRLIHTYLGYGLKTAENGNIHLVRPKK